MASAFADGAFDSHISDPSQLFNLRIPPTSTNLPISWKPAFRERPLFPSPAVDTKPLNYDTLYKWLRRLGKTTGFRQILKPYNIRRGVGEAVQGVATQPQLQQIMHHRDAGTQQAYQNSKIQVDVQAAFLKTACQKDSAAALTHMRRNYHPGAPVGLTTDEAERWITASAEMQEYEGQRKALRELIRTKHAFVATDVRNNTPEAEAHADLQRQISAYKTRRRGELSKQKQTTFFDEFSRHEVDRQLDGHDPSKIEPTKTALADRQTLMNLMIPLHETDPATRGVELVRALIIHAGSTTRKFSRKPEIKSTVVECQAPCEQSKEVLVDCDSSQCIFCFFTDSLAVESRSYRHASVYKLRDHVEKHANTQLELQKSVQCPHTSCGTMGRLGAAAGPLLHLNVFIHMAFFLANTVIEAGAM